MMNEQKARKAAEKKAREFLTKYSDFRLGDIEAEQSHPLTRNMSEAFERSIPEGVRLLTDCDARLGPKVRATLQSETYARMEADILKTLSDGGRIILSGCGSSGRLCMRIENSFRLAVERIGKKAKRYENRILSLMTGGDYAVIRAVEFFEDFTELGRKQAEEFGLGEKDLLIGVTATGETTSILGTAARALDDGAAVWMVVCSDPEAFYERLPRAKTVYHRDRTRVLLLPCGPMALTGSTRMQSSTYEQTVIAIAVERALHLLTGETVRSLDAYADDFESILLQIGSESCVNLISKQIALEKSVYDRNSFVTYYADEYLLDVLTDTTERSPTFMTPPFVSAGMVGQKQSWAFVKNPSCDTETSWTRCFRRPPRCIEWNREVFASLNLEDAVIDRIPPIGLKALCEFRIGCEPTPERETPENSTAVWIGAEKASAAFTEQAVRYRQSSSFTFEEAGVRPPKTSMDIFEHLAMKMMLNDFSTATMVCMGRIHGNWMTFLNISNKKLVDRAGRIISLLCEIPYEKALEELFYTEELLSAAHDTEKSSTQETLRRLKSGGRG